MYRVVCTGLGHPCAGHRCGSYTAGHGLVQDKVQDYLVEKTHVRCRAVCTLCAQPSCRAATCVPSSEPSSVQTSVCAPQEQRTYIRIAQLLYLHMGQINQDAYCSKKWSYFSQLWVIISTTFEMKVSYLKHFSGTFFLAQVRIWNQI